MHGLLRTPGRRLIRPALLAAACALALGACGGDGGGGEDGGQRTGAAERPPGLPADFNLQLANCGLWRTADADTRDYLLRRLRQVTNGEISGTGIRGRGAVVPDDQAAQLLDNRCSQRGSRGFLLYKLYGHAAGFTGARP